MHPFRYFYFSELSTEFKYGFNSKTSADRAAESTPIVRIFNGN